MVSRIITHLVGSIERTWTAITETSGPKTRKTRGAEAPLELTEMTIPGGNIREL